VARPDPFAYTGDPMDHPRAAAPASRRRRPLLAATAGLLLASLASAPPLHAQAPDPVRIGITWGGVSFLGLTFEYQWESFSVEANVGTWTLRDLSVSVVGKHYFGPAEDLRPYVGGGLWGVLAFAEEGRGSVLVLRAPVGFEWEFVDRNYLGVGMSINRGLWVDRIDPDDETPLNKRLVPLPGFYYRWRP